MSKRIFDLIFTIPGLLFLSPILLAVAVWIRLDSPGPVLFKQKRVGRCGRPFFVMKFRTMMADAEAKGARITVGGDPRITRIGAFLRKCKLDELPQLFNVLKGEMSLVGPRPEVPEYVDQYPEDIKEIVFSVPPGMTDYASIEYKDENDILAASDDPQRDYVEKIMPIKLNYYKKYVEERSLWLDFILILRTIKAIIV